MSTLDKMNLRPSEKRLVVVIGLVLFVVLNIWFVVPFFSEMSKTRERKEKAERTLLAFNEQIAQMGRYEAQVKAMASQGLDVAPEEQSVQFMRVIQNQQALSGVNITGSSRATTRTNQFFIDQSQQVSVQAGEKQLVDFLYNLGAGNSLVRVRELSLGPDATRQNLLANIQLVASYQKKTTQRLPAPLPDAARVAAATRTPVPAAVATNRTATSSTRPPAVATNRPGTVPVRSPGATNTIRTTSVKNVTAPRAPTGPTRVTAPASSKPAASKTNVSPAASAATKPAK